MRIFTSLLYKTKKNARYGAVSVALVIGFLATGALGDELDDSLPASTPEAVKIITRQAIQSGLERESLVKLTRAMLQARFNEQQIQLAHTLLLEAKNSGMPVRAMMNKAFEGLAKNVSSSRILNAMEAVQARNAFAYQLSAQLTNHKGRTEILGRTMAAGLTAGLSKKDADKITNILQQRAAAMGSDQAYSLAFECFQTARDVSRLGVSSQDVTGMVTQALKKGFSHEDMFAMRNSFLIQARQSEPQNLVRGYTTAIQKGKGFQEDSRGSDGQIGGPSLGGPGVGGGAGSGGPGPGNGGGSGPGSGGSGRGGSGE